MSFQSRQDSPANISLFGDTLVTDNLLRADVFLQTTQQIECYSTPKFKPTESDVQLEQQSREILIPEYELKEAAGRS